MGYRSPEGPFWRVDAMGTQSLWPTSLSGGEYLSFAFWRCSRRLSRPVAGLVLCLDGWMGKEVVGRGVLGSGGIHLPLDFARRFDLGSSSVSIDMLSLFDRGGRGLGQVEEGSVAPPPPNSFPFL